MRLDGKKVEVKLALPKEVLGLGRTDMRGGGTDTREQRRAMQRPDLYMGPPLTQARLNLRRSNCFPRSTRHVRRRTHCTSPIPTWPAHLQERIEFAEGLQHVEAYMGCAHRAAASHTFGYSLPYLGMQPRVRTQGCSLRYAGMQPRLSSPNAAEHPHLGTHR